MDFAGYLAGFAGLALFSLFFGWLAARWAGHVAFARRERHFRSSRLLVRGISGSTEDYEPLWFGIGLVWISLMAVLAAVLSLVGVALLLAGLFHVKYP